MTDKDKYFTVIECATQGTGTSQLDRPSAIGGRNIDLQASSPTGPSQLDGPSASATGKNTTTVGEATGKRKSAPDPSEDEKKILMKVFDLAIERVVEGFIVTSHYSEVFKWKEVVRQATARAVDTAKTSLRL